MSKFTGVSTGRTVARSIALVVGLLANIVVVWVAIDKFSPVSPLTSSSRTVSEEPTAGDRDDTGPATESTSLLMTVTPRASGMIDVVERVRTSTPVRQFLLRPPPGSLGNGRRPLILDLTVEVDGRPVRQLPPATPTGATLVVLRGATQEVVLRYRVGGVAKQRRPSPDTRALVTLRPLTLSAVGSSAATVEIVGVVVHNLVCPDRPPEDQLCGRNEGGRWRTVPLPVLESTVVAQVDLPA